MAIAKEDPLGSQNASLLSDANTEVVGSSRIHQDNGTEISCYNSESREISGTAALAWYDITYLKARVLDGMECIEELRTQGSSIAKRVYLLVLEASRRHPSIDQVFFNRDNTSISSKNNNGIPSAAQAQIPHIGANEMLPHDLDDLVKALFTSSSSNSTSQNHELEAILTSFLNDMPL